MANTLLFTPSRALDANAYAAPGATATFYAAGTMTLITVYSDEAGSIATTNPVVADANGIFPQTYAAVEAKVIVRDAGGATLWTIDPVPSTSSAAVGASGVTFTPSAGIPETNVQDAIEAVFASAASGYLDFGLGNTGNAPIISALNDTSTATGMYRFTGATTGTFPSGVVAADTGLVTVDRQTGTEAMMILRVAGSSRVYLRLLSAGTWQAWQEEVFAPTESGVIALSGTATTISTAIPADTKRINVWVRNASLDAVGTAGLQLGTAGAFIGAGYLATSGDRTGETTATARLVDRGGAGGAGNVFDVYYRLRRTTTSTNVWQCDHDGFVQGGVPFSGCGQITLTTAIDRIRYNTSGPNFDGGSVFAEWSAT